MATGKKKTAKPVVEKKPHGRPRKYNKEMDTQVAKLALLGADDKQMADFFEISKSTFNKWKKDFPSFSDSIKSAKLIADSNVAVSLYQRAIGFKNKEDKIFLHEGKPVIVPTTKNYPPDTRAAQFWLKNRQPELWRDTQVIQGDANHPLPITWNEEKTYESKKDSEN